MNKLWAGILKDLRLLIRDKVGLLFMFLMPVVLVVIVTSIQNKTFEVSSDQQIRLLVCNKDARAYSNELLEAIKKVGMFEVREVSTNLEVAMLNQIMKAEDALIVLIIPSDFTLNLQQRINAISDQALSELGLFEAKQVAQEISLQSLFLYYHPVLQESYRSAIRGGLSASLQIITTKALIQNLYEEMGASSSSDNLEKNLLNDPIEITEIPVSKAGRGQVFNASQHNIPAWTVFAMFFMVISLAGNMVKEKLTGSYLRLKSLPTSFVIAILAKQCTYLMMSIIQVAIILLVGICLFPIIGLPPLYLPSNILGLFIVSIFCALCAVNYAICIGIFAQTQEQANGFGAASVVILAALGGILVPAFAMPEGFQTIMGISPLSWCLKAYHTLFLENGGMSEIFKEIIPLIVISLILQFIAIIGLRRQGLV